MAEERNGKALDITDSGLESVVFKGYKSGLYLLFPDNGPFEDHLSVLRKRLAESNGFFKGAGVRLQTGQRTLAKDQLDTLTGLLRDAGMIIETSATDEKIRKSPKKAAARDGDFMANTLTVRQTVRSGQRVEFAGNLLITGDVNPGGEVVATGNIIILGKLRGTAHAGAVGNMQSYIIALHLKPLQIRIADVFTRSPESPKRADTKKDAPEIARIRDGCIIVEKFNWDFTKL